MTPSVDASNWRLAALFVVLLGAAALQVVAAVGTGDEDVQLLVIGTASIVMLLAIGVVMWLVRGLQHDARSVGPERDRQR
jgi:hypothetical protein